jgi:CheY-like chemotaxis protein
MSSVTHVLVVEDDEVVRRALVRGIRKEIKRLELAADLIEADRADQAFERILLSPGDRWFVITDNNLNPSVGSIQTGLDLIYRVHENVPRIRSYRILVSGRGMDMLNLDVFGVDTFMLKPWDVAKITELLVAFIASE